VFLTTQIYLNLFKSYARLQLASSKESSEGAYAPTFPEKKDSAEPLRGLCSCAFCAASGAGAPPRKRGEEAWQNKKGRVAGDGSS
jgi:hypothetical protein